MIDFSSTVVELSGDSEKQKEVQMRQFWIFLRFSSALTGTTPAIRLKQSAGSSKLRWKSVGTAERSGQSKRRCPRFIRM